MNRPELQQAIEALVRGYCFTRSATHPFAADRIEGVWVMRDAPRRHHRDYRVEEWVSHDLPPADVDRIVRAHTRGRFGVGAIRSVDQPAEPLRLEFKRLGYRLITTEPLFVHRLTRIPREDAPVPIEQVLHRELADRFGREWRHRPLSDTLLRPESGLRQYVAWDDGLTGAPRASIVGVVRSVAVGSAHWVGNMYVVRAHRRRGIGRALLLRMLRDNRAAGSTLSVLLSSHIGAMLYPVVGYEQIGELLLFKPGRRNSDPPLVPTAPNGYG